MILEYLKSNKPQRKSHIELRRWKRWSSSGKIAAGRRRAVGGFEHAIGHERHDRDGKGRRQPGTVARSEAKRGLFGYMQYIHGFIGVVLVVMALIHVPFPDPLEWLPFALAAGLAFVTLSQNLSMGIARILAICTAGAMFFFFAMFFLLVPRLDADWYTTQFGWTAVCRILAAFLMLPILSDYSCRLKKDCMEAREARRSAFFSVPSHIRPSR